MRLIKVSCITVFFVLGVFSFISTAYTAPLSDKGVVVENNPQRSAKELYVSNCARCHGGDGTSQTKLGKSLNTPDIADAEWQNDHSDKKIASKINKGGRGMPAFAKKLSPQDVNSLVGYVRSLKK